MSESEQLAFDPALLIEVAAAFLFDDPALLSQAEVAARAGVDIDTANALWHGLGFPQVDDDELAFTPADVEALQQTRRLTDLGVMESDRVQEFARTIGRTFARLADWQIRLLLGQLQESAAGSDGEPPLDVLTEVIPLVESVQNYVWRRHLLAQASRIALRDVRSETDPVVVGFVDIVGYTSRSRQLSARALGVMVERFERGVTELVVARGGQVVKTIGDEALFTLDDPAEAAELALELVEQAETEEGFPEVRVGLSLGPVLPRLGDVFGSTVNLAARLTSLARPSSVLLDAELAGLVDDEQYRLRRIRRTSVKGFETQELWSLKRPR